MASQTTMTQIDTEKILNILVGVPGSGKSTFANDMLLKHYGSDKNKSHEADNFKNLYKDGVFNPKLLKQAHKWCLNGVKKDMEKGLSLIVQSNTNLEIEHMKNYIVLCVQYGYHINVVLPESEYLYYESSSGMTEIEEVIYNRSNKTDGKCIPRDKMELMIDMFVRVKKSIESFRLNSLFDNNNPNDWITYIDDKFRDGIIANTFSDDRVFETRQHIHTKQMGMIFTDDIEEDDDALNNNPIYMCYLVSGEDRKFIQSVVDFNTKEEFHITTHFNSRQNPDCIQKFFEDSTCLPKMNFTITKILSSMDGNLVCAMIEPIFEVETDIFKDKIPHITLFADRKKFSPVESNELCKRYLEMTQ
jgi:hypothetical protein